MVLCLGLYIFALYLLQSSVNLLRQFVRDHTQMGSNERTARLHIWLILCLFISTTIYYVLAIVTHFRAIKHDDLYLRN